MSFVPPASAPRRVPNPPPGGATSPCSGANSDADLDRRISGAEASLMRGFTAFLQSADPPTSAILCSESGPRRWPSQLGRFGGLHISFWRVNAHPKFIFRAPHGPTAPRLCYDLVSRWPRGTPLLSLPSYFLHAAGHRSPLLE